MAADRTLTKAQKNAVFRELIALQIDPRGFEWEAAQSTYALTVDVSVLKHVVSGFYFKFDIGYCRWSPSKQGRKEEVNRHDNTWTPVIQLVKE